MQRKPSADLFSSLGQVLSLALWRVQKGLFHAGHAGKSAAASIINGDKAFPVYG